MWKACLCGWDGKGFEREVERQRNTITFGAQTHNTCWALVCVEVGSVKRNDPQTGMKNGFRDKCHVPRFHMQRSMTRQPFISVMPVISRLLSDVPNVAWTIPLSSVFMDVKSCMISVSSE